MFRIVYSILFALCMPFVYLKLLWRGYKAPEYKARKLERFGVFDAPKLASPIWVHAVSVGEVLAAEPIIREIQARFPSRHIVVTSMTPTSSELIKKLFGASVFHVYAPYDLPILVKAFMRRIQPAYLFIMETELWPNMIHHAYRKNCPVVLVNARLSERSAAGYRRFSPAVGWMLNELSMVLCQFESDAERFAGLGISRQKIHVTGSVKYDIEIAPDIESKAAKIRENISSEVTVWIAASTHEGEDELMLEAHQALKETMPDALLILVPRHPERFDSTVRLAESSGLKTHRRTEHKFIPRDSEVFVVDTMGELMTFFAVSNVAFIGGSFAEVGGHNPIEPGALGIPILIGPHIFNFEAICGQLKNAGGLKMVANLSDLTDSLRDLLSHPTKAENMGMLAKADVETGRGAVGRVVDQLAPLVVSPT